MGNESLNRYSHLTAIERDGPSFPAKVLMDRLLLKGNVLDFGCGYGADSFFLNKNGISTTAYDPHYYPEFPKNQFDTIICFYVLNVLLPDEQAQVLREVSCLLKPGGMAYYAVRRDIQFEGYRQHKVHLKKTFQCHVNLPFDSIIKNDFCEIYAFQKGVFNVAKPNQDCPFCGPIASNEVICETTLSYAIYDRFPVSEGHALIVPKIHEPDFFQLTKEIQNDLWGTVSFVQDILRQNRNPAGFNVGINCGTAAGQTVPHAHIHLIPRQLGDIEDPRGGVRGVIPHKRIYKP